MLFDQYGGFGGWVEANKGMAIGIAVAIIAVLCFAYWYFCVRTTDEEVAATMMRGYLPGGRYSAYTHMGKR